MWRRSCRVKHWRHYWYGDSPAQSRAKSLLWLCCYRFCPHILFTWLRLSRVWRLSVHLTETVSCVQTECSLDWDCLVCANSVHLTETASCVQTECSLDWDCLVCADWVFTWLRLSRVCRLRVHLTDTVSCVQTECSLDWDCLVCADSVHLTETVSCVQTVFTWLRLSRVCRLSVHLNETVSCVQTECSLKWEMSRVCRLSVRLNETVSSYVQTECSPDWDCLVCADCVFTLDWVCLVYADWMCLVCADWMFNWLSVSRVCRLSRYFRGQHHLEEIMYCCNLSRQTVTTLLDKFNLMLCIVEGPARTPPLLVT